MNPSGRKPFRRPVFLLILSVMSFLALPMVADEIRPALLDIKEQNTGLFAITWKVPMRNGRSLAIKPRLPASLEQVGSPRSQDVPGARIVQTTYRNTEDSLTGRTIVIEGLETVQTDVLLLVQLKDGTEHSAILRPISASFTVPFQASKLKIAGDYWRMGAIHILEGVDHLLFVLALMLIVQGFGPLLKAVTAFTVAHSITLGLATLGVVNMPAAPTEAVISLSIVFLASEILRMQAGKKPLTAKYPWIVAFSFGLFHGLGFAGALSEIGVPQNEVPLALLMFNVGVETGQVLFVAVVAGLLAVAARLQTRVDLKMPEWSRKIAPYAIGIIAAYWTIERTVGFLIG